MTDTIDLGSDLDKLAHEMLTDAAKEGVKLSERLEVFKILSNHYVNVEKVNAKRPLPAGPGKTMSDLKAEIDGGSSEGESDEPS